MITKLTVVICDTCGKTKEAKPVTFRNETEYSLPDGWRRLVFDNVHVCPECVAVLGERMRTP